MKTTGHPRQAKNTPGIGVLRELDPDRFTVRLRSPGGRFSPADLRAIAAVAEAHAGQIHLTVRQSLELVHVSDPGAALARLAAAGQFPASTGARFRVPVACGGCEYNPHGLVDTQAAAIALDRCLTLVDSGHHKFKVAFAGCPNDCPKSATNDLGFCGAVLPALDAARCNGCGRCARACHEGAITCADGTLEWTADRCAHCGDCIKACPRNAWTPARKGYLVSVGGKWGRQPVIGSTVAEFLPEDRVVDFAHAVFEWYRTAAQGRGRIRMAELLLGGLEPLLDALRPRFGRWLVEHPRPPLPLQVDRGRGRQDFVHCPEPVAAGPSKSRVHERGRQKSWAAE